MNTSIFKDMLNDIKIPANVDKEHAARLTELIDLFRGAIEEDKGIFMAVDHGKTTSICINNLSAVQLAEIISMVLDSHPAVAMAGMVLEAAKRGKQ